MVRMGSSGPAVVCGRPPRDSVGLPAHALEVLGLEVRNDVKHEGMRRETLGPKAQPDVSLVLEPPAANPNASPDDKQVMSELLANGVLRAVNWAIQNRERYGINIINMSLGTPVRESWRKDPLCVAVAHAVRAGIVVEGRVAGYNGLIEYGVGVVQQSAAVAARSGVAADLGVVGDQVAAV